MSEPIPAYVNDPDYDPEDEGYEVLGPLTFDEYFEMPETTERQELVYGWLVREPATMYGHQDSLGRLVSLLRQHCERYDIGVTIASAFDVILDERRWLILQPDVMVVKNERRHQIQGCLWGAPNVAIEILSPRTTKRDRNQKVEWYRQYGVEEYWIVDTAKRQIEVIDFVTTPAPPPVMYQESDLLKSTALPGFTARVTEFLEPEWSAAQTGPTPESRKRRADMMARKREAARRSRASSGCESEAGEAYDTHGTGYDTDES